MRLSPGDSCTLKRSFSASDVQAFGTASGDWNPVHYPEKHAKVTQLETEKWRADPKTKDLPLPTTGIFRFPKPIVHGMLTASLIGTLFATHLPGSIYLQQSLQFRAPVFYDEQVVAKIEVISVDRKRVLCKTTVEKIDASGKTIVCVEGEARVMVDSLQA
jgi:acyl dehydratase